MTEAVDNLFGALGAGRGLSVRSTGTAPEVITTRVDPPDATPPSASPGPMSPSPAAERSMRYGKTVSLATPIEPNPTLTRTPIVSERVAANLTTSLNLEPSIRKHATSRVSDTITSASDLSEIEARPKHRRKHHSSRRKKTSHRDIPKASSSRKDSGIPSRSHAERKSRRSRSSSSSSSSSSDDSRRRDRHRRRRHRKHRSRTPPPAPKEVVEVVQKDEDCGRCGKLRLTDPLDPALSGMSSKQKERNRQEIIRRIQRMKKNNPGEDIQLPVRGINDPVACYRRYKRIARHLYAKRSIASYHLIVFAFTLVVQVAMSILFGPAAAEYLKKEYEQIHKYDAVFYEMGCRAYSPYSSPQSPEYRFAWQLITPILIIAIAYFIGRYTPVPPVAINIFTTMATAYLKSEEIVEYRTLLHDEDNDEPDEQESDSDDEVDTHAERCKERPSRVVIPDLEAELPSENIGTAAIQAAVPGLVNMITSLRAQPTSSATAAGQPAVAVPTDMMGTLLNLAQTFMGGAKPANTTPAAAKPKPPKPSDPVAYTE